MDTKENETCTPIARTEDSGRHESTIRERNRVAGDSEGTSNALRQDEMAKDLSHLRSGASGDVFRSVSMEIHIISTAVRGLVLLVDGASPRRTLIKPTIRGSKTHKVKVGQLFDADSAVLADLFYG
jgi:hypothetical protein